MQANEVRELDAASRLRFDLFLMRCFLTVNPGAIFMDNWHIDHMAYQAERIVNGEVRRLIVNMPPRNLKSLTFNVALSAFLLGHDPAQAHLLYQLRCRACSRTFRAIQGHRPIEVVSANFPAHAHQAHGR